MATVTSLKIVYNGSGSRYWARKLMIDLALYTDLSDEMALCEIDIDSANLNQRWGIWNQNQPGAAGDRRPVEFLPGLIYSPEISFKWAASNTPVSYRIQRQKTAPTVNQHNADQELVVEATSSEDTDLAFQALFTNPSRHLSLYAAWEFFMELLQLNYEYLPAIAVT